MELRNGSMSSENKNYKFDVLSAREYSIHLNYDIVFLTSEEKQINSDTFTQQYILPYLFFIVHLAIGNIFNAIIYLLLHEFKIL